MSTNFTKNKQKVVVAMSGGVDSSVAAALLKEQGHEVIGITMNLACSSRASDKGCCSISAANDARKVADALGIPHYTLNFKDDFRRLVIDNFIEEYRNGRTPNPCIRCNQYIKFDLLLKKARELGAEFVATGHYARVVSKPSPPLSPSPNGRGGGLATQKAGGEGCWKLLKGKDQKKDQSYVLYRLTQGQLARIIFPLGEMTKEEVRQKAKGLRLPVADKGESQEICFVEDDDYGRFLREFVPEAVRPGPILDRRGNIVGMHGGIAFYTIGQRKGVGHHRGNPKYVVEIDRKRNAVVIGDQDDTLADELVAEDVSFVSSKVPPASLEVTAKIRYNSPEASGVVRLLGPSTSSGQSGAVVRIEFEKPQRAVTPGQSVVFYKGEEVIGGGVIK
jgi:tRNA-specific 2-thiouridylase